MMLTMQFTPELHQQLHDAYVRAVKNKQKTFTFQDKEFLTTYAKYVLLYLDNNRNIVKRK